MCFFSRIFFLWLIIQLIHAAEDKKKFVTCDLDLPKEAWPYLPAECQGLNESTRKKLKKEASSFKAFNEKLTSYEASLGADSEDEIYKDWDFRAKLYERAELHLCQNQTETLPDYLECLTAKRGEMIQMIDDKIAGK